MYAKNFKRCLMGLLVCLIAFSLCFSLHFTVLATDGDDSSENSGGSTISSSQGNDPTPSDNPEPSSSDAPSSTPSSKVSSQAPSRPTNSEPSSQAPSWQQTSSSTSSEDIISQVSEGGAPDQYDEQYYSDGSYEYHGSYAGLSSKEESKEETKPKKEPTKRSALADQYAQIFTIGMIVFGALSILMIVLLIYFNLKVKESKRIHPEWYHRKKKRAKRSKH